MNTRPDYDPTLTIYTETSDEQGSLTAHIITNTTSINPANAKPNIMAFFDTLDEMHAAVKEHYGEPARYVGRAEFLAVMEHRGMSPSLLEA